MIQSSKERYEDHWLGYRRVLVGIAVPIGHEAKPSISARKLQQIRMAAALIRLADERHCLHRF
jgi:hypothetical protein